MNKPLDGPTPRTPAPVEVGILEGKTIVEQVAWYSESLSQGAIHDGLVDVWGVYISGTDTPICHTGNGPASEANARFITKCFNEYANLERIAAEAVRALEYALSHVTELRDAWQRGAINECDGKGGMRSNRNVETEQRVRAALARIKAAGRTAQEQKRD